MAAVAELKEVVEGPKAETPLEKLRKSFRISDRKPESKDKCRLELVMDVEWDDPETGKTQIGVFRALRMNMGAFSRFQVLNASLNAGQFLPANAEYLHRAMAFCQVVIQQAPDWWKPEALFEPDPLLVLYDHVRDWDDSFRRPGVGG